MNRSNEWMIRLIIDGSNLSYGPVMSCSFLYNTVIYHITHYCWEFSAFASLCPTKEISNTFDSVPCNVYALWATEWIRMELSKTTEKKRKENMRQAGIRNGICLCMREVSNVFRRGDFLFKYNSVMKHFCTFVFASHGDHQQCRVTIFKLWKMEIFDELSVGYLKVRPKIQYPYPFFICERFLFVLSVLQSLCD